LFLEWEDSHCLSSRPGAMLLALVFYDIKKLVPLTYLLAAAEKKKCLGGSKKSVSEGLMG